MEDMVGLATDTRSTPMWLMAFSSESGREQTGVTLVRMSIVEVLSLGFAAAAFALYVWSPFGSKGAEQLVVRPLLRHTRFWMIASDEMALHVNQ